MFENVMNQAAGWIEGLTYPKSGIQLDEVKYQWGVKQKKTLYSHATQADGTLFSIIRTSNQSLAGLKIVDIPLKENEVRDMLTFFSGDSMGNQKMKHADKLSLLPFRLHPDHAYAI